METIQRWINGKIVGNHSAPSPHPFPHLLCSNSIPCSETISFIAPKNTTKFDTAHSSANAKLTHPSFSPLSLLLLYLSLAPLLSSTVQCTIWTI